MSGGPRPSVLTALPDGWDADVVVALGTRVTVGRRCVDLPDLMAAAEAGLGDVVLLSARLRRLDLSAVRDLRLRSVGVVGLVAPGDEAEETRLRQLGVSTLVPADAAPADLYAAVVAALARTTAASPADQPAGEADPADPASRSPEPAGRGRVIAVWGPHGAPGRTTLAVNLAIELGAAGVRTLLVDLDTHAASVAQHLAVLDEAPGLAAACRAAEHGTLDRLSLARLAPEVAPGVRVLTGIPAADRWPEVRSAAVERILDVARLEHDLVLVDCAASLDDDEELSYDTLAPRRNMATLTALEVADEVLAVGAADPVGLQRLVRGLRDLGDRDVEPRAVVVNKLRSAAVGPRAGERVRVLLERFAGVARLRLLPFDPDAADQALLGGVSLREAAPGSPLAPALADVARLLLSWLDLGDVSGES
ncbi:AAA family ATPase [Arsenicicoccus dermatophilus]|uniref:AAA family ATPase n=1 Tax=Arsenicicoccus dermatophilus TaxID=1076331 RepID=UPI001F4C937D|nr:AAA family ATPase [Arsenicicoccus dermatophilus]MCH8613584.1 AAA family ATPase [Arsenicicoccus dermatophilus]